MASRYRKIVIPLDGSLLAEQVFAYVQQLTSPATTELVLVTILEPWRFIPYPGEPRALPPVDPMRTSAETYLACQYEQWQSLGYQVYIYLGEGDAAHEILGVAESSGADLIAMTTHGRSGFERWTLGSVAERVIQGAKLPILLVREATQVRSNQLQRLLIPLDGSTWAEGALPQAQALAQATGAQILLLQVIQSLDEGSQQILFEDKAVANTVYKDWRAHAEEYLSQVAQRLQIANVSSDYRVLWGDPDKVICKAVTDENIDLLVMSTHGRSGLSRWFYGSVANKVLRNAPCPLLLIRSIQSSTGLSPASGRQNMPNDNNTMETNPEGGIQ